ncbi:unnamed protein product, partial [Litomosoides sigmodontis]
MQFQKAQTAQTKPLHPPAQKRPKTQQMEPLDLSVPKFGERETESQNSLVNKKLPNSSYSVDTFASSLSLKGH